MKQTNNAIKFLMAQYRAIFKNANIAMVAAMAAAALAAGSANAADGLTGELQATANAAQDIVVSSGSHDLDASSKKFAKSLTINKGASATIKSGGVTSLGDVNLNSGSLTVSGTTAGLFLGAIKEVDSTPRQHYEYDLTATNRSTITLDQANIGVANFDIAGSTISLKAGGAGGTNLTAYGVGAYQGDSGPEKLSYQAIGKLTDVTANLVGGTNITAVGHLDVKGSSKEKSEINLKGTDANSSTDYQKTLAYLGGSKKLTIDNTTINASGTAATGSKGAALVSPDLKINNSKIVVAGANDALTLGGFGDRKSAGGASSLQASDYAAGTASIANSTITVSGTLNLGHGEHSKTSFTLTGNTITNAGTINAYGDVTVEAVDGLFGENGTLNLKGSTLTVTGNKAIDLSKASVKMTADAGSELVAENASVTVAEGFRTIAPSITAASVTASKTDGSFTIKSGESITVSNALTVTPKDGKASLAVGGKLTLEGKSGSIGADVDVVADQNQAGALAVNKGTWSVQNLKITSGSTLVSGENSVLTIGKKLETTATNGTMSIDKNAKVDASAADINLAKATIDVKNGSTLVLDGKDVFKKKSDGNFETVTSGTDVKSTFAAGSVKTDSTSILQLNYTGNLAVDDLDKIKTAINADYGLKGFIKIAGVNITGKPTQDTGIDKVKDGFDGLYNDVAITVDNGTVNKSFTADQVKLTGTETTASVANEKTVMLTGKKGDFITTNAGEAADAKVGSGSSLVLAGNGDIGAISASSTSAGQKGTVAIGHSSLGYGTVNANSIDGGTAGLDVAVYGSTLNVAGKVAATDLTLEKGSTLNIKAEAGQGAVTAATLNLGAGSSINAAGQDISVSSDSEEAKIFGDVEAGSLSLSGGATIAGGADVNLGTLNLSGGKILNVGRDGEDGSTASVFTDKLEMGAGSTIFVDPSYKDHATVLATKVLTDGTADDDVSVSNGTIKVGKNAAFGIGFDQAEFDSVMANYLVDGKFTDPVNNQGYANAFVLNTSLKINSGAGVAVKHDLQDSDTVTGNSFTLGERAALIITDKAFGADKTGTAITFGDSNSGVATATVTADASSVISLVGDFDVNDTDLKIFAAVNTGSAGTVTINGGNSGIKVQALGGLLSGTLATNGSIDTLTLDPVAEKAIRSEVSAPVGQLFVDIANGKFDGATGAGYDFLVEALSYKQFKAVDAAAHAATYAGAQQAAVVSVTTMADAMFGRVGAVGVEAASISATGSQANGGVWLTPMYKSMDADGFNAEGVSYGSDVDAAGVAFGADTVNGNMRFGAVFNIGSGDAEGKGQGNGLKDEFDYYGFGIYSAMGFGNLALIGDASMTVVSHDVQGLGLRGKADTTAVTMGLTGQYTVSTPMVDVTPHLGARFIRLNTDSYDLVGADGAIATTDFDVQNVFSVPLGVTLSKGFVTGGWTLAPSADLTITFNGGDTEAKSSTTFTGIKAINMNTEVLDEVTYGLTLGLGAQYGAFGTSFGINYTGSENTDSFGVNAQARYMF